LKSLELLPPTRLLFLHRGMNGRGKKKLGEGEEEKNLVEREGELRCNGKEWKGGEGGRGN
jgi:hypothetical protein